VLGDEFTEAQTLVQLTYQNQAAVRCDPRALEVDLQSDVTREPWKSTFNEVFNDS
jgi:hypothetical protein